MDYDKLNNSPMAIHIIDNIYVSKSPNEDYTWFDIHKYICGVNGNKAFKFRYIIDINNFNNYKPYYNVNCLMKYYDITKLHLNSKTLLLETKFNEIFNILETKQEKEIALIVSKYGINRPSLIVIPYLCKKYNLDEESASRLFYYKIFDGF